MSVRKFSELTAKTINNRLTPLRGVYQLAVGVGVTTVDLTQHIKNLKHQQPEPDPFTRSEMESILGYIHMNYPAQVWRWYIFAFLTGVRPSEQLELEWNDVDWVAKTVKIERARVAGKVKPIKTHSIRHVELSGRAASMLAKLKADSDPAVEHIFTSPYTGRAWSDDELQTRLEKFWYPTLSAVGVRSRIAYNTRHTYATINLMAGVNPAYIARQLGHKSTKMLFERYSRWIDMADRGRERAKEDAE